MNAIAATPLNSYSTIAFKASLVRQLQVLLAISVFPTALLPAPRFTYSEAFAQHCPRRSHRKTAHRGHRSLRPLIVPLLHTVPPPPADRASYLPTLQRGNAIAAASANSGFPDGGRASPHLGAPGSARRRNHAPRFLHYAPAAEGSQRHGCGGPQEPRRPRLRVSEHTRRRVRSKTMNSAVFGRVCL
jgi:hypothetical protein